jgi:hypothetical protein
MATIMMLSLNVGAKPKSLWISTVEIIEWFIHQVKKRTHYDMIFPCITYILLAYRPYHHSVGMAGITKISTGFPGYNEWAENDILKGQCKIMNNVGNDEPTPLPPT